jgi:predicted nuclease of restriction endonuclease-like RecB superfamily
MEPRIVPVYFDHADRSWIEPLIELYSRHVGKTRRELRAMLAERGLNGDTPYKQNKQRLILSLLNKQYLAEIQLKSPSPRVLRQEVFRAAAESPASLAVDRRSQIFSQVAKKFEMTTDEIDHNLYGDLPLEKVLTAPKAPLDPETIRLQGNLALVKTFLAASEKVRILIRGNARPVVRHAKWKGLICSIRDFSEPGAVLVEVSGPLAILQRTLIYGRALGELVPYLGNMKDFVLEAKIRGSNGMRILRVKSGDPIFPKESLKKYDSKLEEQFAKRFLKATNDWDLVREPGPFQTEDEFVYPDFAIKHRTRPDLIWQMEIVGFWTPEYLGQKLLKYRRAKIPRLILCLRESHQCKDGDLPASAKIVRFKTAVKPEDVLAVIDQI